MIDNHKYVFILGAGASKPYGFPTGIELYEMMPTEVLANVRDFLGSNSELSVLINQAESFASMLGSVSERSIDKYLNIHEEFATMGRVFIATAILIAEAKARLPHIGMCEDRDWYGLLWDKMTEKLISASDMMSIHKNKIGFITFNYDRTLESFLYENLCNYLGKKGRDCESISEVISQIPIIHVFGKVADLPWQHGLFDWSEGEFDKSRPIVKFGDSKLFPAGVAYYIHKSIQLMYEERRTSAVLQQAKNLIAGASHVLFLGFGYREENMQLLGMPGALSGKQVYGTAVDMTSREKSRVKSLLGDFSNRTDTVFWDRKCKEFLREVFP